MTHLLAISFFIYLNHVSKRNANKTLLYDICFKTESILLGYVGNANKD